MKKFLSLPLYFKMFILSSLVMCAILCYFLSFTWSTRLDYSFGYLTPIFVAYILWERRGQIAGYFSPTGGVSPQSADGASKLSFLLDIFFSATLCGSLLLYMISSFAFYISGNMGMPSFAMAISTSFATFSMAFLVSDKDVCGNVKSVKERLGFLSLFIFPCFIWIVSAPVFNSIEMFISSFLLNMVAKIDYEVMYFLGFVVSLKGNILEFPNGSVGVAEACSGIRSLTACIFAGSFLAASMLDRTWKQFALVISSMVLAFIFNLLRAFFLALWAYENGSDSISGAVHDTAGYIILGCTVVGLMVLVSIFNISPVPPEERGKSESRE